MTLKDSEGNLESGVSSSATPVPSLSKEPVAASNPDIIEWDGPEDSQNPLNWPNSKKYTQLAVMAVNTFLTPLASSMFSPALESVMVSFHCQDPLLGAFTVSIYILGYTFGPLIIAPASELYGRLMVYHTCNILYLLFTVACALSRSLEQLLAFRFLAGVAGVCPLTIGSGTATDLIPAERRAGIMAIWSLGPVLGPVIGPIAGGFLSEDEGWRWVFWLLSIVTGAAILVSFFSYHETYAPVLLERKAARLRKETGNPNLRSIYDTRRPTKDLFLAAFLRPIKMLIRSPIVTVLALYASITYGYLYLMFTTTATIFRNVYGFSQADSGLAYVGFGVGCVLSLLVTGNISNRIAASHIKQGCFRPESRIPPLLIGCWFLPIGLFWYGWSVEMHIHWIMPIIGMGIFGVGMMTIMVSCGTYLVDSYPLYAASVSASQTMLRSLVGATLPLAGPSMYDALGIGWGNSVLGFIALAFCVFPFLFLRYGERLRTSKKFDVQL